jgi:hypothetical protein
VNNDRHDARKAAADKAAAHRADRAAAAAKARNAKAAGTGRVVDVQA